MGVPVRKNMPLGKILARAMRCLEMQTPLRERSIHA